MLVKAVLKNAIETALQTAATSAENSQDPISALADGLATAIDDYIKSAQVAPGIPVATTGSPAAQTGATTGLGTLQ
jgi:hypothetical protein